jgi:phytoene dehydrogenase-like protein
VGLRARRHGRGFEAIAASARSRGVQIRTNAPVAQKILKRDGRAQGVVLEGGEEIEAPRSPAISTRKRHVPPHAGWTRAICPGFVDAIRKFRSEGTSLQDQSRAERPAANFTRTVRRARPAAPRHHAHLSLVEYIERAWDDAKYGRPSQSPLLELTMPTMYDQSLAPARQARHGNLPAIRAYTLREGTGTNCANPSPIACLD